MAVDAEIWMDPPPTREEYPALLAKFRADWPDEPPPGTRRFPDLRPDGCVLSLWRYYGEESRRGHWPTIRRMIEWLWANTTSQVRYGSDHDVDEAPVFTATDLARLQAVYDAHGQDQ